MPVPAPSSAREPAPNPEQPLPTIIVFEAPRLLLTINEAALYLRVSTRTVHTLIKTKQLKYTRVREGLRFRLQWLNEYLDKRTVPVS